MMGAMMDTRILLRESYHVDQTMNDDFQATAVRLSLEAFFSSMRLRMRLLVGDRPRPLNIALMLLMGAMLAFFTFCLLGVGHWMHWMVLGLAFDIGAGLISNATQSTNQAWREQPVHRQKSFVLLHLTLYPLAVVFLSRDLWVSLLLLGFLLVKVGFFVRRVMRHL